jgi:hypothetical protein
MSEQEFDRPPHPDFEVLASSVRDLDELVADNEDFDFNALIDYYVDPESLAYVAIQRSMRAFGVRNLSELQEMAEYVQRGSALWTEAFLMGAEYMEEKSDDADHLTK